MSVVLSKILRIFVAVLFLRNIPLIFLLTYLIPSANSFKFLKVICLSKKGHSEMDQYPAVSFMVKYGRSFSKLIGFCPTIIALIGFLDADWHWVWLIVAVVAGVAIWFLFMTFVELTQIIADMLLPQ